MYNIPSVFYTTDGSEPTLQSNVYNASTGIPLYGFGEKTVKVRSFKQHYINSPMAEASYSILPQMVSTMAGSSVGIQGVQDGFGTFSGFSNPTQLVVTRDYTRAYIADTGNNKIRQFDMQSGFTATLVGGLKGFSDGVGTEARFDKPYGLALTRDGKYLYVSDSGNNKIRKVEVLTRNVQTMFTLQHEQSPYLFKRSDTSFTMMSTNNFIVERSSMIYESKLVHSNQKVQCESKSFIDSKGHQCPDYDVNPQWCGFEQSAFSCCICGGGNDVEVPQNASNYSFTEIRGVALSVDETVLYVCDIGRNTVNAVNLSTGQVRILSGGGVNSSKDIAYGTRAGFYRPFGLDVTQRTASETSTILCDYFCTYYIRLLYNLLEFFFQVGFRRWEKLCSLLIKTVSGQLTLSRVWFVVSYLLWTNRRFVMTLISCAIMDAWPAQQCLILETWLSHKTAILYT